MIRLGGYTPTKPIASDAQVPAQTAGAIITRGGAGEMFAEVPKVDGAIYYGCILVAGKPLPDAITLNANGQLVVVDNKTPEPPTEAKAASSSIIIVFDITKSRKKRFVGLQTGTLYYFYFYAANAAGVSILSEERSLTCG